MTLKSIMDVDVRCVCGWVGTVWDCEPDVDGDGSLGCPTCLKVIEIIEVTMRRFFLRRLPHETSDTDTGIGRVAEGIEFSSGVCVVSWMGDVRLIAAVYANINDLMEIHGENGRVTVEFVD